jgi:hypothetical protein
MDEQPHLEQSNAGAGAGAGFAMAMAASAKVMRVTENFILTCLFGI